MIISMTADTEEYDRYIRVKRILKDIEYSQLIVGYNRIHFSLDEKIEPRRLTPRVLIGAYSGPEVATIIGATGLKRMIIRYIKHYTRQGRLSMRTVPRYPSDLIILKESDAPRTKEMWRRRRRDLRAVGL